MASLASHKTAEIILAHFSRSQLAELHGHLLLMTPQITAMNFSSRDANKFLKEALKELGLPNEAIYAKICKRVPPAPPDSEHDGKGSDRILEPSTCKIMIFIRFCTKESRRARKGGKILLKFQLLFLLM